MLDLKKHFDILASEQQPYSPHRSEPAPISVPIVSVHLITYQHVNYISQCLENILRQKTSFPFEIIIGEDESNDGTRDICVAYADKYPGRIKLFLRTRGQTVIPRPDGGYIYLNGKLTLRACRGKYIALCEGDDYWTDPLKLQKQVDFLEQHPDVAACAHNHDILTMHPDGSSFMEKPLRRIVSRSYSTAEIIANGMFIKTASLVFRRTLIDEIFEDIEYHLNFRVGDYPLLFLLSTKGPIHVLKESMSVYRKNLSSAWNPLDAEKKFTISIEMYEKLLSRNPSFQKEIEKRVSVCRLFLLKGLLDSGDFSRFLATLRKNIADSSLPPYVHLCRLASFLIIRYLVDALSFGIRKTRRVGVFLFSSFLSREPE